MRDVVPGCWDVRDVDGFHGSASQRTAAIVQGLAHVAAGGGGTLHLPAGDWTIEDTVTLASPWSGLAGRGETTRLIWAGPQTTAPMVRVSPVPGPESVPLRGCSVRGMELRCEGRAGRGLEILSSRTGTFRHLAISNAWCGGALHLGVVAQLAPGQARDCQNNEVSAIDIRQLGDTDGYALSLGGDHISNASYNRLSQINVLHRKSHGIVLMNCDWNEFSIVRCWAVDASPAIVGVLFCAAPAGARAAHDIRFLHLFASGGVYAQGLEAGGAPSRRNRIEDYDLENGSGRVVVGTGADLVVTSAGRPV